MLSLRDVEGVQREPRLGIGEGKFAEADEAQSEGDEKSQAI
jgi:hypothetical protein